MVVRNCCEWGKGWWTKQYQQLQSNEHQWESGRCFLHCPEHGAGHCKNTRGGTSTEKLHHVYSKLLFLSQIRSFWDFVAWPKGNPRMCDYRGKKSLAHLHWWSLWTCIQLLPPGQSHRQKGAGCPDVSHSFDKVANPLLMWGQEVIEKGGHLLQCPWSCPDLTTGGKISVMPVKITRASGKVLLYEDARTETK